MDKESLKPVIESIIFAADSAISLDKIVTVLDGEPRADVKEALTELIEDYSNRDGGFYIEEVAGGYQFRTKTEFAPWIRRLFKIGAQRISKPAMEALSIIAYRQPVTRGEIEAIRGVDCGGVLATLMDKRFIKIVGRKELPGRPVVYGTTKEFLETFELKDLSCLPSLKDFERMEEENAPEEWVEEGAEETAAGEAPPRSKTDAGDREAARPEGELPEPEDGRAEFPDEGAQAADDGEYGGGYAEEDADDGEEADDDIFYAGEAEPGFPDEDAFEPDDGEEDTDEDGDPGEAYGTEDGEDEEGGGERTRARGAQNEEDGPAEGEED